MLLMTVKMVPSFEKNRLLQRAIKQTATVAVTSKKIIQYLSASVGLKRLLVILFVLMLRELLFCHFFMKYCILYKHICVIHKCTEIYFFDFLL